MPPSFPISSAQEALVSIDDVDDTVGGLGARVDGLWP